jgi:hypothetical protein
VRAIDYYPASDLVGRNFMAEGPNELWVADIAFLATLAYEQFGLVRLTALGHDVPWTKA